MANLQTTISFAVRKRTSLRSSVKSGGKENLNKGSLNVQNSPVKSKPDVPSEIESLKTPGKSSVKRRASGGDEASPPKQEPVSLSTAESPSQLIGSITLSSPGTKSSPVQKELFPTESSLSKARQALHSTTTARLPQREEMLEDLRTVLIKNLEEKTSTTLYISGAPGTGKTACMNTLMADPQVQEGYRMVYVNCTGLRSSGSVYTRIVRELGLKVTGSSEKASLSAIENYLQSSSKMMLLVLDEMDQLETRNQKILYRVFEWPLFGKLVLVGVANSLDLTTRALPRLSAKLPPPLLFHFAPYTKKQIATIIEDRLHEAGVGDIFSGGALQMLAGKVASMSGDVRRALDLARRVIDVSNQGCVTLKDVMNVVRDVYSTSQSLTASATSEAGESYPLQQKLLVSSLLLIKKHSKCKEVTIGKLHEVYKKVCEKRNLSAVELSEFLSLVQLVEARGVLRLHGKTKNRLSKVTLQWDEEEVSTALQDKQLLAVILNDVSCLPR